MSRPKLEELALTRPGPAPDRGPLDERFYDLVEERFRRIVRDHPDFATFIGIHTEDHRLADGERDAVLGEIAADRAHLAAVEAIDPAGLSAEARFERDLEIHNLRRDIFDMDVQRVWERRSTALDGVGDPLFALFARDFAPLEERLDAIASRLEATPAFLAASRSRAAVPQVRLWQTIEIETAGEIPALFDEIVAAGEGGLKATGAAPAAGGRGRRPVRGRRLPDLARGNAGERHRRLGPRARALRRAGRAARVRRPRRRRDPRDRPGAARAARRRPGRGRPRDRPDRRRGDRRRPDQERPSGDVRGGPRRVPRRHGPRPPPPHRARHRDRPRRRADRGHRRPRSTSAT